MANTKKYVSLDKLSLYDEKIKKYLADADAAALQSAKDYADGLATNYDAAGSAESARVAAIDAAKTETTTQVNALANGAVKANADAIAAIKDDANVDSFADVVAELAKKQNTGDYATKAEAQAMADGKDAAIQAAQDAADGAQSTADEAAAAVGELETYVGTFTHDTAKSVVEYINAKTDGIATSGNLEALGSRVTAVEGDVATIKGDYLKAEDKDELQGKIDLKADASALAQEVTDREAAVSDLQTQINTIMNNPDAEGAINSINEFTKYVTDHGTIADGFRTDIDKNKDDIAAMDTAYKAADTEIKGRLDTLEAIDHEAYVAADAALKGELEGKINAKADASALTEAVEALEGADAGQVERIAALEAKFTGDGSVEDMIEEAKQAAIDAAATDATGKANAAEAAAKEHANGLNTTMSGRMDAVEGKAHEHGNKALLDTYTQTESDLSDAVAKKHAHANAGVLDAITAAKVQAWDAAEGNAKTFAQGLNDTMSGRVATLETWHENFVECSQEDIQGLFAQ